MSVTRHHSPGLDPDRGDGLTAALNHELGRHARLLHVMKSQLAPLVPDGLDMAAFSLLFSLVRCGPTRQGELADLTLLDPSTVSRHVAQLARAGYVQRRPDPQDGRAVHLVASEAGEALAVEFGRRRQVIISEALAHWSPDDLRQLVALMARLNDDLDAARPTVVRSRSAPAGDRLPSRPDPRTADVTDVPRTTDVADVSAPRSPDQENA